jgi:internalin A
LLTKLTELTLENNQITNIDSLQSLVNLTKLEISENQITDVSPLRSLTGASHFGRKT